VFCCGGVASSSVVFVVAVGMYVGFACFVSFLTQTPSLNHVHVPVCDMFSAALW